MININAIENVERLQDAFQLFNQLSRDLTNCYHDLESQVPRLKDELAAARSERLRILTEKARLTSRMTQVLEALPGGIIVVDGQNRVVDKNATAGTLLGEPLLGVPWDEVAARCFASKSANPLERRLKNGAYVSIAVSSRTAQPAEQIILLTDVSEMRALQEKLNQHQRLTALGEMAAAMAHQIRTPLSAAVVYASHLGKPNLGDAHRMRFAEKLQERLRHLERQVNDLLVFARGERIGMADFPVRRLLQKVKESLEAVPHAEAVRFRIIDCATVESLHGNEEALLGSLMNLINNALDAMNGLGTMTLAVTQPCPDCLRFSVTDEGPGVTDSHRERIFEPFFTTRANGTGLGLAVVAGVAQAHGGSVHCESAPGRGSVFHLTLPVKTGDAVLPSGSSGVRRVPVSQRS